MKRILTTFCALAVFSSAFAEGARLRWSTAGTYDTYTDAKVIEDIEHYHVHACEYFAVSDTATRGAGDSVVYSFVAPSASTGKFVHIVFAIASDGALDYGLYKNSHGLATDTLGVFNPSFRCTTSAATTVIKGRPDTLGTLVLPGMYGTSGNASGGGRVGGGSRSYFEYNLASDSAYTVRVISRSADNRIHFQADWYEEPNQ